MKVNKSHFRISILISIILVSVITSSIFAPNINLKLNTTRPRQIARQFDDVGLKSASNGLKPLNYSSIYQNVTSLNRLFESIYFNVNISGFKNVISTIIQISHRNILFTNYSMNKLNDDEFEFTYTPEYNASLGLYRVNFFVYNQTNYLLNSQTSFVNFTITSNYVGKINQPDYNRRELADGEFQILNYGLHNFVWDYSIVDNTNSSIQETLFTLGSNIEYFYFELNESFTKSSRNYYVKITVTDTFYSQVKAIYLPFTLLDSIPKINEKSVTFSSTKVKRAEDCTVSLNVTDGDMNIDTFPSNITVYAVIQDSQGIKGSPLLMTNNDDWTFDITFSIAINKPIGRYQVIFEVYDQFNVNSTYIVPLTVENNLPKIHGFTVNGINIDQSISVNYGDDIIFRFNVSDVENTIAYITVQLLNERNEWYNLSISYKEGVELTIRTIDLVSGSWYIYITVIDKDGGVTSLTSDYGYAPKEIRIIPDLLTPVLPWIALLIGVILGVLGGIALVYRYFKSKYVEPQPTTPKKKRLRVKKKKEEPFEEEVEKEEKEPEKEPTEKKPLQRKIKRRLK
jgi:hypothetical protein